MNRTVGVCGYSSSGSSAFIDFLREFDETQILDNFEFQLVHLPDGLEDLEFHVRNYHHYKSSIIAINRFRKFIKTINFMPASGEEIDKITDVFLKKIIQYSCNSSGFYTDRYIHSKLEKLALKLIKKIFRKKKTNKIYYTFKKQFSYKMELSIMSKDFDEASKRFVSDILDAMGRKYQSPGGVIVLDQAFETCNPVKSFKFFENPIALIIDRDPRDNYLFTKNFLQPRGVGNIIPCDNVDDYIKYFRLVRQCPPDLRERGDIIFLNFEELVYDYENTTKKVADFVGVTKHAHKGEFFKPTHSRNNSQLFRKYNGFESDIKKIEKELSEYIFPFENYPDIEPEGGMFWGSQKKKRR